MLLDMFGRMLRRHAAMRPCGAPLKSKHLWKELGICCLPWVTGPSLWLGNAFGLGLGLTPSPWLRLAAVTPAFQLRQLVRMPDLLPMYVLFFLFSKYINVLYKLQINEIFCIGFGYYPESWQNLPYILKALGWRYHYLEDHLLLRLK